MRIQVRCPAKVNLFLAVGPADGRGYHPLRTLFQAVELCDILIIDDEAVETKITCSWDGLPADNTLTKTLRLLSEVLILPPLAIHLEKHIPAQSGLGGGSSDAAGLLRGLQKMGFGLSSAQAMDVAAAVGSDVPFFLVGGLAKGEGYGEKLTPLPNPPEQWLVLAQPEARCSTVEAYSRLDAEPYPWLEFPADDTLYNDFERVAPQDCIDLIAKLKKEGAIGAALSGSGSAVFGKFESKQTAETALKTLPPIDCWLVRTLDRAESLAVGL